MNFRSNDKKLVRAFEKRRLVVINKNPVPASDICNRCWYQAKCIIRTIRGDKPKTCCVYSLFVQGKEKSYTLEETVAYTCEKKCVERQAWQGDPVPHTEDYCNNHCPVSRFIKDEKASKEEDVPTEGLY